MLLEQLPAEHEEIRTVLLQKIQSDIEERDDESKIALWGGERI
jgi:hypothetical protein